MKKLLVTLIILISLVFSLERSEASVVLDEVVVVKAVVTKIIKESTEKIPGTDVIGIKQDLQVKILQGDQAGKFVSVHNDYVKLELDEVFWLRIETRGIEKVVIYSISDQNRLPGIIIFTVIFLLSVFFFGGIQGIRGLISLIGSIVLILYVLLPSILDGYSPVLMTISVSTLIIVLGSYVTHGFNKTTSSAVIGMFITVLATGFLSHWAIAITKLSGFSSDEEVYLNLSTGGNIDMLGLLFGGIIIGLLGVLYDVAIGQAISVEELKNIAPTASRSLIYKRAVRIGREHIGALVNTLAIAYVGVALPLLLLFYTSNGDGVISLAGTINREIFATEIIRILIGSIGLILAVPFTTFIAVYLLIKERKGPITKEDLENISHHHHHH